MPRRLRKKAGPIVLPSFDMNRGIAPPGPVDACPRISIARQPGPQVVHREINRLGKPLWQLGLIGTRFHRVPHHRPAQFDDRIVSVVPLLGYRITIDPRQDVCGLHVPRLGQMLFGQRKLPLSAADVDLRLPLLKLSELQNNVRRKKQWS